MKPAAWVATLFLSAIAVLHVLRLVFQVQVTVDGSDGRIVPSFAPSTFDDPPLRVIHSRKLGSHSWPVRGDRVRPAPRNLR